MKKTHSLLLFPALALTLAATQAHAQRKPRMADRVSALEQQANAPSPVLELLPQIEEMRSEIQSLRAQIEELQHQNAETARNGRTQYLDVDTRLQRLETSVAELSAVRQAAEQTLVEDGGSTEAPAATPATPEERSRYEAALNALKAGQYVEAARQFSDFLDAYPNGAYAPNAIYWLGESYYVTENYTLALEEFSTLVTRWPRHDKTPGGLLKIGLSQLGLKKNQEARQTLEAVVQQYPNTDAARVASQRLRTLR